MACVSGLEKEGTRNSKKKYPHSPLLGIPKNKRRKDAQKEKTTTRDNRI